MKDALKVYCKKCKIIKWVDLKNGFNQKCNCGGDLMNWMINNNDYSEKRFLETN